MKNRKILLVPSLNIIMQKLHYYLPYGLLSLQATATASGVKVDILPTQTKQLSQKFQNADELVKTIIRDVSWKAYDVLGLSTVCNSFHHSLYIAKLAKQQAPWLSIWLGGPHVSVVAKQVLDTISYIDAVFIGEAEDSFAEILTRREQGDFNLCSVPGVLTRENDYIPRQIINNLDELQWIGFAPDYLSSLLATESTSEIKSIPLEVSRGCPNKCTFCSTFKYWEPRVRRKSNSRIIKEMKYLSNLTGMKFFDLIGDSFGAPPRTLLHFSETMCQEVPDFTWACSLRTCDVTQGSLNTLWEGGCRGMFFGIESASDETLKRVKKKVKLERDLKMIAKAVEMGFDVVTSFIIGFPWETTADVNKTFRLHCDMLKLGVARSQICLLCPLPGTELIKKHPLIRSSQPSSIVLDDIHLGPGTCELIECFPSLFMQLSRYETPYVDDVHLQTTHDAASQLYHLSRK